MKLFEATWRDGYEYYERYFDTCSNKSVKKRINLKHEWYEPSSKGLYTSVLDETIKLEKKQGRSKDAQGNYGVLDPMYRNIRDNYWGENTPEDYNKKPRTWYLDIETRVGTQSNCFPVPDKALEPISLIQIYDSIEETMIVLGLREWKHQNDYEFNYPVKYIKCTDEIHLIQTYLAIFKKLDPVILYAWNGIGFDYPYIYNRIKNLGLDTNSMSNYGNVTLKEKIYQGRQEFILNADGHYYIDLMVIYKKFTFKPRPNYSLDTIAEIELKQNKVQHTEYAAFDDFYTGKYIIPENPTEEQKNSKIYQEALKGNTAEVKELAHSEFVYYGCIDTYLIKKLDDKRMFTNLLILVSEMMGVTMGEASATVKPWSQYISNTLIQDNKVLPPRKEHDNPKIVGGYVREIQQGKHPWVLSIDINSMYPLLSMTGFNMSPETFIPKHKLPGKIRDIVLQYFSTQEEENLLNLPSEVWETLIPELQSNKIALGINGAAFDCSNLGMIPEMVLNIYKTRKQAKKEQFQYEQRKILIQEMINER